MAVVKLLKRTAASLVAGTGFPESLPRALPGSAFVRNARRGRLGLQAQIRARHAPPSALFFGLLNRVEEPPCDRADFVEELERFACTVDFDCTDVGEQLQVGVDLFG